MLRQWKAEIRNWIGSSKHGLRVISARRRGRGTPIPCEELPTAVQDFLFCLHPEYKLGSNDLRGCKCSLGPEFSTFESLANSDNVKLSVRKVLGRTVATITFTVDEDDPAERLLPIHSAAKEIARQCGMQSLLDVYRCLYDGSASGVSVGFNLSTSGWVYCRELPSEDIDSLLQSGVQIMGFRVRGYVEGWDGDLPVHTLTKSRSRSVSASDIWDAVHEADTEALEMRHETHGCPDCGPENEFGRHTINPSCRSCHGDGMII